MFLCRFKEEGCLRLTALATIIRMMRAVVDGIHPGAIFCQLIFHLLVNLSQGLLSEIAPGNS